SESDDMDTPSNDKNNQTDKDICNHLWWSAQSRGGDAALFIEKFTSILHHIKNEHKWLTDGVWKTCEHKRLTKEDGEQKCG
ncbi:hypothetical protein ILUMI_17284, partial [Ignelater luminosus]